MKELKSEEKIIEKIFNNFSLQNDYWDSRKIKSAIAEGIKMGRKQLAEELNKIKYGKIK